MRFTMMSQRGGIWHKIHFWDSRCTWGMRLHAASSLSASPSVPARLSSSSFAVASASLSSGAGAFRLAALLGSSRSAWGDTIIFPQSSLTAAGRVTSTAICSSSRAWLWLWPAGLLLLVLPGVRIFDLLAVFGLLSLALRLRRKTRPSTSTIS